MGIINSIITGFFEGGFVMWPILLFSVYSITLIVERFIHYGRQYNIVKICWNRTKNLTHMSDLRNIKLGKKTVPGRIVKLVLLQRNLSVDDINEKVRQLYGEESVCLEKYLNTIAIIGSLLPMLGLLGTVVGMISSFNAIVLHGTGNPKIMAEGISQALLTTEAGLLTSIPIIYLHHLLSDRADNILRRLDQFSMHILHINKQRIENIK